MESAATPMVSVVVPAFNAGTYLTAAIESLLAQTYQDLEIIVVDDGSSPPCRDICDAFPSVRYAAQPRRGPAGARNAGIRLSRAPLVAFQDADDISTPERIATQVGALQRDPSLGFVLSRLENFHDPDLAPPAWFHGEAELRDRMGFIQSALVRREILARVGPFDEAYLIGEDIDWLVRARDAGIRSEVCPQALVRRRIHDHNLSADIRLGHRNLARILHASLERRRSAP